GCQSEAHLQSGCGLYGVYRLPGICLNPFSVNQIALFFFQAEDGIRDFHVTGVQTCALPISYIRACPNIWLPDLAVEAIIKNFLRSEERRVGKECRSRWPPYPYKKRRADRGLR